MAEKPPTAAEFEQWLEPSDVIEWYNQQREPNPKALVISMLSDGLLQAAAARLVIHGKDVGRALIARELWPAIAATQPDVWHTGRFRLATTKPGGERLGVSGYDVRIDRDIRTLPGPDPALAGPNQNRPKPAPAKGKGGRSSGHHGVVIATLAKRLMGLSEAELQAYAPRRLQSELIEEYLAHGATPPSAENVRLIAAGILKALRN